MIGVVTIFLVALGMSAVFHTPFMDGLVFGSIIALTDDVAVESVFKRFTVPQRLGLIIEGESIFNDTTRLDSIYVIIGIMFANSAF